MALEISLIGPPRVARDGEPVSFDTRKAMALLAHLALAERPRSRDALCELLWPGRDPEHARGALRRTLSTLRKAVGEDSLDTTGDSIALVRGGELALDVEQFRTLAADGASLEALLEAATLFSAGFLEGFSLRDSPAFDDWQVGEAGALERELATALRRLVMRLAARGDYEQAIPHARRWLELDPLHEPAHRELIRLYAWSGDRAAALNQYRECVRTLSQELGVAPVEETATLYDQVSEGAMAPPPEAEAPPAAATHAKLGEPPAELPLVGRSDELAALAGAHARARPDGGLAVIEGEAGIGKTRLAHELARNARELGAVVLAARCHEDEAGLPYGPIVELLRQAAGHIEPGGSLAALPPQRLADASLLLPELAGLGEAADQALPLDGPGAQVRVLEGVAAVIGAACEGPRAGSRPARRRPRRGRGHAGHDLLSRPQAARPGPAAGAGLAQRGGSAGTSASSPRGGPGPRRKGGDREPRAPERGRGRDAGAGGSARRCRIRTRTPRVPRERGTAAIRGRVPRGSGRGR